MESLDVQVPIKFILPSATLKAEVSNVFSKYYGFKWPATLDMSNDNIVILDVGSSIGDFALWLTTTHGKHWKGATIHCYEPVAELYNCLTTNVAIFGIYPTIVVEPHFSAIAPTNHKDINVYIDDENMYNSSLIASVGARANSAITIIHAADLPQCDIIKVNIGPQLSAAILCEYLHNHTPRLVLINSDPSNITHILRNATVMDKYSIYKLIITREFDNTPAYLILERNINWKPPLAANIVAKRAINRRKAR